MHLSSKLRLPLSALALLALVARVSAQDPTDVVYLRDGVTETGKVLEEPLSGLAFQPESGAKKTLQWADVQSVEYGDAPDAFAAGQSALGAGDFEDALKQFSAVLAEQDLRPVVRQQALFQKAGAELRSDADGTEDAARADYQQLLRDFPKGRFVRMACENLMGLYLKKGDAAGAQTVLDDASKGLSGVAGAEAIVGVLAGNMLLTSGKGDEAAKRFAAVEALAGAEPALVQEARLGRARTLILANKAAEAEPILRELVEKSTIARVLSGAWNGIGDLGAKEGHDKRNTDRCLDAVFAYLRGVVQYKPLPGETTIEYERALAGAAQCFQYLSELESNPDKKKVWRDRQRDLVERLQREFPRSPFLEKG